MNPITIESLTLVILLCYVIDHVKTQVTFDLDPYEPRREALPGSRLLKALLANYSPYLTRLSPRRVKPGRRSVRRFETP
jgi:hypothetical protein